MSLNITPSALFSSINTDPVHGLVGYLGENFSFDWTVDFTGAEELQSQSLIVDVLFELVDDATGQVVETETGSVFTGFQSEPVASYTGFSTLSLDTAAMHGDYTLRMTVDPNSDHAETDERDNIFETSLRMFERYTVSSALSDPIEVSRQNPVSWTSGDELEVDFSFELESLAGNSAVADMEYALVLSEDFLFDAGDEVLERARLSSLVFDGTTYSGTVALTLPEGLEDGLSTLGLRLDPENEVLGRINAAYDSNFDASSSILTASNSVTNPQSPPAEGSGYTVDASFTETVEISRQFSSIYAAGDQFELTLDLNILPPEGADIVPDMTYHVTVSDGFNYDSEDQVFQTGTLADFTAIGTNYSGTISFTVPAGLDLGLLYVGFKLDPDQAYLDSSQFYEATESFTVTQDDFDLFLRDLTTVDPVVADGDSIPLLFSYNNVGTFATPVTLPVLSAELVEMVNGVEEVSFLSLGLLPDVTRYGDERQLRWDLPVSDLDGAIAPGDYTLRITTDALELFTEVDETNNEIEIDITVQGDGGTDFDGNGHDDILFFNGNTRAVGQFEMPTGDWAGIGQAGTGWKAVGAGRFDRQGSDLSDDILWYNESTGWIGRFDMDGGSKTWKAITSVGAGWDIAGIGDFNGDGLDDILMFNDATNTMGQFRVTDSGVSWRGLGTTNSVWDIVGVGDFDDDGIDDVLWQSNATGDIGQHRMSATGKQWMGMVGLSDGKVVAVGDFHGAESDDVLVQNESNGALTIYDNFQGNIFAQELARGGSGWSLEGAADFDRNGTDDILWRHEDGRIGQYVMNDGEASWASIGFAGSDWDVIL